MAKLNMKKHQRTLVTSFKQYQIDDLAQYGTPGQILPFKSDDEDAISGLISTGIQARESDVARAELETFERNEEITDHQKALLREIHKEFRPD